MQGSAVMTMTNRLASWAGARLSQRVSRSLPWIGAAVAVVTVASTMRRKGVISGVLDTGPNAMPFIGSEERHRGGSGRDFPDRYGLELCRPDHAVTTAFHRPTTCRCGQYGARVVGVRSSPPPAPALRRHARRTSSSYIIFIIPAAVASSWTTVKSQSSEFRPIATPSRRCPRRTTRRA